MRVDQALNRSGHPDDHGDQHVNQLVPIPRPGTVCEAFAQIPGHATHDNRAPARKHPPHGGLPAEDPIPLRGRTTPGPVPS